MVWPTRKPGAGEARQNQVGSLLGAPTRQARPYGGDANVQVKQRHHALVPGRQRPPPGQLPPLQPGLQ